MLEDETQSVQCDYRFKFKECEACGAQNDIAARVCQTCDETLADPDDKLRAALNLKDALVLRCSGLSASRLNVNSELLKLTYFDEDGASCDEIFDFSHRGSRYIFNQQFGKRSASGTHPKDYLSVDEVVTEQYDLVAPDFVIARKNKKYGWKVADKLFDYQGAFRKANQLSC